MGSRCRASKHDRACCPRSRRTPNPVHPIRALAPFQAVRYPPRSHQLGPGSDHDIDIAETHLHLHPDLPPVPVWGFGSQGHLSSPGPLLETTPPGHLYVQEIVEDQPVASSCNYLERRPRPDTGLRVGWPPIRPDPTPASRSTTGSRCDPGCGSGSYGGSSTSPVTPTPCTSTSRCSSRSARPARDWSSLIPRPVPISTTPTPAPPQRPLLPDPDNPSRALSPQAACRSRTDS